MLDFMLKQRHHQLYEEPSSDHLHHFGSIISGVNDINLTLPVLKTHIKMLDLS